MVSKEGTTQGDPLGMFIFGVGVLPLVKKLKNPETRKQNWYADDSGCGGLLLAIRKWFDEFLVEGPKYGNYPEPLKCILVGLRTFAPLNNKPKTERRRHFSHELTQEL